MRGGEALFRETSDDEGNAVTHIELFFDLIFVFAITQLSHRLLAHLTPIGVLESMLLLLAVWWAWIYTSWITNWLDPQHANVRLMLLLLMMLGLALSSAIPYAFGSTAWLFAAAYWSLQMVRTLYMVRASWGIHPNRARNFMRVAFWFLLSLPFWVAGVVVGGEGRLLCWGAALLIEYAGPYVFFHTPWLGRSLSSDWDIAGGHMAERCALFIIIALGETLLVTGAIFAQLTKDAMHWAAFVTAFVGTATLWWIYFDTGARRGVDRMEHAANPGQLARDAYTYWHIPIVAGIIVSAVGDEKIMAHPTGSSDPALLMTVIGGPMLFLIGNAGFKWLTSGMRWPPFSHGVGALLLLGVAVGAVLGQWQPLTVGIAAVGALIATAIWEWGSFHGGWQRWTPWLGRLFGTKVARG